MTQIGILSLALYYIASTIVWGRVVCRLLPLSRAWSRLFGFLLGFYLSALAAGIPVVLWRYDRALTVVALLLVLVVGWLLSLRGSLASRDDRSNPINALMAIVKLLHYALRASLAMTRSWQFITFGLFSVVFVYLLARVRTGDYILSPWDILSPLTLAVFFIMTFLLFQLIFSKHSVKIVLAIIIAFSYLTHLYLPLVYKTGFGGDKWRHLGAERWLASVESGAPAKHAIAWGEQKGLRRLAAVDKISYTPMWVATVFIAEALGIDVFWVDLFLVFLLWSFFLPLILYQFGRLFSPLPEGGLEPVPTPPPETSSGQALMRGREGVGEERLGLVFAFLPVLFANFQTEGAITLPVSFSHLFFFFVLLLWAYYVKTGRRSLLAAASALTIFSYWGYVLNFIVLVIVGLLAIGFYFFTLHNMMLKQACPDPAPRNQFGAGLDAGVRVQHDEDRCFRNNNRHAEPMTSVRAGFISASLVFFFVGAALVIPFLEVGQGLSKWGIGSFPAAAFVNFIYHPGEKITALPAVLSALVWLAVGWGLYRAFRSRQNQAGWFLALIFIILLAAYFVSWTFTGGEHILARRLPESIVFLAILSLGLGIMWLHNQINRRGAKVVIGLVLALAAASTYASGPVSELVTSDQLAAAELVWPEIKDAGPPYCVIANTWPLLALESVSGERVIGGGFPIVAPNYQQPERVRLFKGLSINPKMEWFDEAFRATGASACYYLNEPRWLNRIAASNTTYLLGQSRRVGEVYMWRVSKK